MQRAMARQAEAERETSSWTEAKVRGMALLSRVGS